MTIYYSDVWDKTMFYLKNETKFFTSSEVKNIIVRDTFSRIAEEIGYPKSNHSSFLTSGAWQVSTPIDFIKIDPNSHVVFENGSGNINRLEPKNQVDIGREEILSAVPGTPENYFLDSESMIGIYPPSTSGCVVIPYVKQPTWKTYSGSGTVYSGAAFVNGSSTNEIMDKCYMAAVYWTVSECLSKDEDARSETYNAKYWNEISRLKSQYNLMLEIRRDLIPHKDYTK